MAKREKAGGARDLTMGVDDQMLVCLEIMANGEDLLAIGTWEAPIKRLAMKECAIQVGNGYRITDKGRAELAKAEGVPIETVAALEPHRANWIITVLPDDGGLVILRKNELVVSGYEALRATWVPVIPDYLNSVDTVAIRDNVAEFIKAVAELAEKQPDG